MLHCLVIRRVGSFSYTFRAGICLVVCPFIRFVLESVWLFVRLHVSCWNLSGRLAAGEFLLHAPCWNLSGLSSGYDSLLHGPYYNMFDRSSDGKSVLHALHLILSHCSSCRESFTGPVMESIWFFGLFGCSSGYEFLLHALSLNPSRRSEYGESL